MLNPRSFRMELLSITMVMGAMGSTIRGAVLTLSVNWSKRPLPILVVDLQLCMYFTVMTYFYICINHFVIILYYTVSVFYNYA